MNALQLPTLTVRARLILGVSALIALLAVSAGISFTLLRGIDSKRTELTDLAAPYSAALNSAALTAKAVANDERGFLMTGDGKFLDEISERVEKAQAALKEAGAVYPSDSEDARLVGQISQSFDAWVTAIRGEFEQYKSDKQGAIELALGDNRSLRKAYEELFASAQERSDANVASSNGSLSGKVSSGKTILLVTFALVLALGIAIAVWVITGLRRGLSEVLGRPRSLDENCHTSLGAGLAAIASGDLTREVVPVTEPIEHVGGDEIGQLAATTNSVIAKTHESIRDYDETRLGLLSAIGEVSETATAVGSASQQMATSSEEAGRAVGEIANAVGDVAQGAERQVRMVENAQRETAETAETAQQARSVAEEGIVAAQSANEAMRAVRDSSAAVTNVIRELAGKSEQIGGIVDTITGIAGQTNLLALNAAIEAARGRSGTRLRGRRRGGAQARRGVAARCRDDLGADRRDSG